MEKPDSNDPETPSAADRSDNPAGSSESETSRSGKTGREVIERRRGRGLFGLDTKTLDARNDMWRWW